MEEAQQQRATDSPVMWRCPLCNRHIPEDDIVRDPGGWRCAVCDRRLSGEDIEKRVSTVIRDLVSAQVDAAKVGRVGVATVSDVLMAAFDEFGGPHRLGSEWARVIKMMVDHADETGKGADKAHRAILEFTRIAQRREEEMAGEKNYEDMTSEELEEERKTAMLEMLSDFVRQSTATKLLEAAELLAEVPSIDADNVLELVSEGLPDESA